MLNSSAIPCEMISLDYDHLFHYFGIIVELGEEGEKVVRVCVHQFRNRGGRNRAYRSHRSRV